MKHSIRTRILAILGAMAVSYLLLLAMVQSTAGATQRHMDRVSLVLFPATSQLKGVESSFQQQQKRYKDAVLLEDSSMLEVADKDSEAVASGLSGLSAAVAGSPELVARVDDISAQFASIHSRSHETYRVLVASRDDVTDELQAKVAALATDNRRMAATMQDLDNSLAVQGREEFNATQVWSNRSRITGWAMLMLGLAGCVGAWWVLQYRVILPLDRLARRMRDIAEGDGDLTHRVEVRGHDELDEVGLWFNVFIERIEQIVLRVTGNARDLGDAATGLAGIAHETAMQSARSRLRCVGSARRRRAPRRTRARPSRTPTPAGRRSSPLSRRSSNCCWRTRRPRTRSRNSASRAMRSAGSSG